jgi:Zn-dependent peptidase ImmA (M78 family)
MMDTIKKKAHSLALDTRLKLGLHSTEFIDVYRAITAFGITCVKRPLESSISGATVWAGKKVKVILVNSSKSVGHQNFTVAHEMYHCLYDEGMLNKTCKAEVFKRTRSNEHMADLFATYLLMPEDGIYKQVSHRQKLEKGLDIADIVHLEQYFSVSRKAMCWRLEELKLISRQQCDQYELNVKRSARLLGKDTALYDPSYKEALISDYAEKAREALEKELITESRYEELLADAGLLQFVLESENDTIAD